MDYINAIVRYYGCFSFYGTTYVGEKQKFGINISGKINKKSVIIFSIIGLIVLFFNIIGENKNKLTSIICSVIFIITIIAILVKSKLVFNKLEGKPTNLNIYERELPSNLRPAHVRMLLNDGLIDEVALYATLLDLIDRGYIEVLKKHGTGTEKICNQEQDEMILKRTDKSVEKLLEFEKFLIKWFIEKYGQNGEVSTKTIHEKLTNNIYQEQPCEIFLEWQGLVLMSFPMEKYYKKTNSKARFKYIFLIILGLFIFQPIGLFISFYALGNLLYASPLCILNKNGIEEKDKWLDLKKYLLDFSYVQDKTIEMVKIWNFYLTYSVVFDIADVSKNEIEKFIGERVYIKFEDTQKNESELKIIELRDKAINNEEIENKINNELNKYNLNR